MKNSNDTIRNRTGDFPACSAVPQPTAPPQDTTQFSHPKTNNNLMFSLQYYYSDVSLRDAAKVWFQRRTCSSLLQRTDPTVFPSMTAVWTACLLAAGSRCLLFDGCKWLCGSYHLDKPTEKLLLSQFKVRQERETGLPVGLTIKF
jgi:hypothetical protein